MYTGQTQQFMIFKQITFFILYISNISNIKKFQLSVLLAIMSSISLSWSPMNWTEENVSKIRYSQSEHVARN